VPVVITPPAIREASYVDDGIDLPTWPPPPSASAPPLAEVSGAASEPEITIDVVISEPPPAVVPVAEAADGVGAQVSEPVGATGAESVERLVAAQPMDPETAIEVTIPPEPAIESLAPTAVHEVLAEARPAEALQAFEATESTALQAGVDAEPLEADSIEPEPLEGEPIETEVPRAPASSRRPVALSADEPIADIAFGAEELQAPRHTPPPESGQLPASPVEEFDADVTGVRAAPQPEGVLRAEGDEPTTVQQLLPEITRAALSAASAAVTEVVGQAKPFAPTTFAAWLDATLALD
jgi:hypothetical protein